MVEGVPVYSRADKGRLGPPFPVPVSSRPHHATRSTSGWYTRFTGYVPSIPLWSVSPSPRAGAGRSLTHSIVLTPELRSKGPRIVTHLTSRVWTSSKRRVRVVTNSYHLKHLRIEPDGTSIPNGHGVDRQSDSGSSPVSNLE